MIRSGEGNVPGRRPLGPPGALVRRGGQRLWHGTRRVVATVGAGILVTWRMMTGTVVDARRLRRTEAGGVADEAAMIAIVLAAAVLIGGIVFGLVEAAGEDLELEIPTGGGEEED